MTFKDHWKHAYYHLLARALEEGYSDTAAEEFASAHAGKRAMGVLTDAADAARMREKESRL